MRSKLPSTENDVKSRIIDWFKNMGGWSCASPAGRGLGTHGIADRHGVIPVTITEQMVGKRVGLFVAIEAKKPGRRGEKNAGATQNQIDYLTDVLDHGGVAALVDNEIDLMNISSDLALFLNVPDAVLRSRERLLYRTTNNG